MFLNLLVVSSNRMQLLWQWNSKSSLQYFSINLQQGSINGLNFYLDDVKWIEISGGVFNLHGKQIPSSYAVLQVNRFLCLFIHSQMICYEQSLGSGMVRLGSVPQLCDYSAPRYHGLMPVADPAVSNTFFFLKGD